MNESADYLAFVDVMRTLQTIFKLKAEAGDFKLVMKAYFDALAKYDIAQVRAAVDRWIARGKYFPKPAELVEMMPAREQLRAAMNDDDAREYLRAEKLGFEDAPCHCDTCRWAGATELRYVPEWEIDPRTGYDRDVRVTEPITGRIVVRGHWAHGEELLRWYAAKDAFWAKVRKLFPDITLKEPLHANFPQEPVA